MEDIAVKLSIREVPKKQGMVHIILRNCIVNTCSMENINNVIYEIIEQIEKGQRICGEKI